MDVVVLKVGEVSAAAGVLNISQTKHTPLYTNNWRNKVTLKI